jgi:hypothetical protein
MPQARVRVSVCRVARAAAVASALMGLATRFAVAEERRTWSSSDGKYSVAAEFVELVDGVVRLRREDGRIARIPLDRLSDADQRYVRQKQAAKPADSPPFEEEDTGGGSPTAKATPSAGAGADGAANSASTANAGGLSIVADGAGLNIDEAQKDAFRNAVRQAVGLVVDADTLVRNDQLVEDKVLTYSDGFITKFEQVPGSLKQQGGLVRLKIKAQVERKSLVERLKAANISLKAVDGKSLFARAVTELEAKNDTGKLLAKSLAELPRLLTAEIEGEPDFDKDKSEIVARVIVRADRAAYGTFVKRLEETLDKIAVAKDSTLLKAEPGQSREQAGGFFTRNHPPFGGPRLASANQWCIWVNNFNNATHTVLKWNGYVVECDPQPIIAALEVSTIDDYLLTRGPIDPDAIRRGGGRTMVTVSALDENGQLVTEDDVELLAGKDTTYSYGHSSDGAPPFLRHVFPRDLTGSQGSLNYNNVSAWLVNRERDNRSNPMSVNLYVSPYALAVKPSGYGWSVGLYPELKTVRRIKVTLDELKRIAQFKCAVSHHAGAR